jgi:hypothetical protein
MARAAVGLLLLVLCGCSGASATTTPPDEPGRYADYNGTSHPEADQCSLPGEQRTGGWFCLETK